MALRNSSEWWDVTGPNSENWDVAGTPVGRKAPVWEKIGRHWAEEGVTEAWWAKAMKISSLENRKEHKNWRWSGKLGLTRQKEWELAGSSRKGIFNKELVTRTADVELPTHLQEHQPVILAGDDWDWLRTERGRHENGIQWELCLRI